MKQHARKRHAPALPAPSYEARPPSIAEKLLGLQSERAPPIPPLRNILVAALVSGIIAIVVALVRFASPSLHSAIFIAPFYGTTMLFGFPESPFCQPRNVVGGHVISALSGILVAQGLKLSELPEAFGAALAAPICIAVASLCMMSTGTMHPPAAATAVLAMGSIGLPFVLSRAFL